AALQQLILFSLHGLEVLYSDYGGILDPIRFQLVQFALEVSIPSHLLSDLTGKHTGRSTIRSQHQFDVRSPPAGSALHGLGQHDAAIVVSSCTKSAEGIEEVIVPALTG